MKKILILLVVLLTITGCGSVKKFYLDDELYNRAIITDISKDKFNELISDKKSFMVYVYLPDCSSCAQFKKVLNEYLKSNKIEIYSISIKDIDGTVLKKKVKFAPSLVLYNGGKYVDFLDSESDKDKFALTNVEGLRDWLDKHIYLK